MHLSTMFISLAILPHEYWSLPSVESHSFPSHGRECLGTRSQPMKTYMRSRPRGPSRGHGSRDKSIIPKVVAQWSYSICAPTVPSPHSLTGWYSKVMDRIVKVRAWGALLGHACGAPGDQSVVFVGKMAEIYGESALLSRTTVVNDMNCAGSPRSVDV